MRTNIELDEKLVDRLMLMTGIKTKRALVDEALRELEKRRRVEWILSLRGKLTSWEGDIAKGRNER